jgi:hypothetical protein
MIRFLKVKEHWGFFERRILDPSNGANVASQLAIFFVCTSIVYGKDRLTAHVQPEIIVTRYCTKLNFSTFGD